MTCVQPKYMPGPKAGVVPPYRRIDPTVNNLPQEGAEAGLAVRLAQYGVPAAGAIVRHLQAFINNRSLFDLLLALVPVVDPYSATGLVIGGVYLGAAAEAVREYLEAILVILRPGNTGCPVVPPSVYTALEQARAGDLEAINRFYREQLLTEPPDYLGWINQPALIKDWLAAQQPALEPALTALFAGRVQDYIKELVIYKTGRDPLQQRQAWAELPALVSAAFNLPGLGA